MSGSNELFNGVIKSVGKIETKKKDSTECVKYFNGKPFYGGTDNNNFIKGFKGWIIWHKKLLKKNKEAWCSFIIAGLFHATIDIDVININ